MRSVVDDVVSVGRSAVVGDVLTVDAGPELGLRAADAVRDAIEPGQVAAGWLPFDELADCAQFTIGEWVPAGSTADRSMPASRWRISADPSLESYEASVGAALDEIRSGAVGKVVLGRSLIVEADQDLRADPILDRLLADQSGCTVFRAGRVIGASPELLVSKRGSGILSRPLAGTAPWGAGGTAARERLATVKEQREHAFVVDHVAARLREVCTGVEVAEPHVVGLADVSHLATDVRATCGPDALTLAAMLHPTPAVCGVDPQAAMDVIRRLEAPRGLFSGVVGWVDAEGNGEFHYVLRCAHIEGNRARLWAGAGIVEGSRPELEVEETRAKLRAMLGAIVRP